MESQIPNGQSGAAPRPIRLLIGLTVALLPVLVLVTYVSCGSWNTAVKKRNLSTVLSLSLGEIASNNTYCGVQILGDAEYRLQVARALHLLKLADPESLALVTNNIRIIIEAKRSGILLWSNSPVFSLSRTQAFSSLTWCAGTIVHGSHRGLIDLHSATDRKGSGTKPSFRELQASELACIRRQIKALKRIGAPRFEIDHCRSCDGLHFDANGDGRYDSNDFQLYRW